MAHMANSKHILDDFATALEDVSTIKRPAKVEGRSMILILAAKK
jgi:Translation initiation factor IF-3, C-terminal domain.